MLYLMHLSGYVSDTIAWILLLQSQLMEVTVKTIVMASLVLITWPVENAGLLDSTTSSFMLFSLPYQDYRG